MKKIVTWLFATVGAVVLLFGYRTSTQAVSPSAQLAATPPQTSAGAPAPAPSPQAQGTPAGTLKDGTYTGRSQNTRYGPVQVRVTVAGGKVSDATATTYPQESRTDQMINSQAIPMLQQETPGTTTGRIDMISGATFTSQGYIGSLQDAIDQAHP